MDRGVKMTENKTEKLKALQRNPLLPPSDTEESSDIDEECELLDKSTDETESLESAQTEKLKYPRSVFFIVSNEFCERFSYYGMRTILSFYLVYVLMYTEEDAKVLYHLFTMFVYFFPIFGAMIADSFLGKFRTIFYVSCIYAVGNVILSLAAITPLSLPQKEISMLGLMLIAVGTGGIKPCVAAFGGDQFVLPQQEMQLAKFFSMFYFSINAGSLISTVLTPVLRENVSCFGADSCYPLAFGVPGVLMIVSIVIFVSGRSLYRIKKPTGNVVLNVTKCISHAVAVKVGGKSKEKKDHWLDHANDKYDEKFINDIKAALKVLVLYIPIPVFWALFDQQGTGWTFQASRMSGDTGFFTILPDQMQVVNPLLILAFIPLFDTCIYPLLAKCHFLRKPLQKLTVGGLLAAVAFCISALVEIQLSKTYPVLPQSGEAQIRLYNTLPCNVTVNNLSTDDIHVPYMGYHELKHFKVTKKENLTYNIIPDSSCNIKKVEHSFEVKEKDMIAHFYRSDSGNQLSVVDIVDNVDKSSNGYPLVRTLVNTPNDEIYDISYIGKDHKKNSVTNSSNTGDLTKMPPDTYEILVNKNKLTDIKLKLGGVYTVLLDADRSRHELVTITEPNSLHILWLIPQYVVITMAEIMFSITGLEFSYSQAPVSMKSVMQACWLLTTAFGNLLVVVIEEARIFNDQASLFFLYAGLMVADMIIFAFLAMRYRYVERSEENSSVAVEDVTMTTQDVKGVENETFKYDEHL